MTKGTEKARAWPAWHSLGAAEISNSTVEDRTDDDGRSRRSSKTRHRIGSHRLRQQRGWRCRRHTCALSLRAVHTCNTSNNTSGLKMILCCLSLLRVSVTHGLEEDFLHLPVVLLVPVVSDRPGREVRRLLSAGPFVKPEHFLGDEASERALTDRKRRGSRDRARSHFGEFLRWRSDGGRGVSTRTTAHTRIHRHTNTKLPVLSVSFSLTSKSISPLPSRSMARKSFTASSSLSGWPSSRIVLASSSSSMVPLPSCRYRIEQCA